MQSFEKWIFQSYYIMFLIYFRPGNRSSLDSTNNLETAPTLLHLLQIVSATVGQLATVHDMYNHRELLIWRELVKSTVGSCFLF